MRDAVVLVDGDGAIVETSPAFEALLGWSEEELKGRPLRQLYVDESDDRPDESRTVDVPLSSDVALTRPTRRYRHRAGGEMRRRYVSIPLLDESGTSSGRLEVLRDTPAHAWRSQALMTLIGFLAERRGDVDVSRFLDLGCRYFELELGVLQGVDARIEAVAGELAVELPELEIGATCLIPSAPIGRESAVIADPCGEAAALLRTARGSVELRTLLTCPVHGDDQSRGTLLFADRRSRQRPFDGEETTILRFMARWLTSTKDAEVTKRSFEAANQRLRTSEERFRSLYEKTPVMMHSIDDRGRIASVSDVWLATMGYERDEVIGRPTTDFLTPKSRRYAEDVAIPAYHATGCCSDIAYQFVTRRGEIRDMLLSAVSHYDDDGTFVRSMAVLLDVTERRQVERALARKTEALERSNADLARFAHVASHDLQEPLRRIIGYCEILMEDHGAELSEEAAEIAGVIQSGGRRLRLIINDLFAYIRVSEQLNRAFEPVDMSALLHHALDDLGDEIASCGAVIEAAHLPLVWGRAPLLKVVLQHLLRNAIRHGARGAPAIDVAVDEAGEFWRFSVSDAGRGVEPRFADRIFEIFERLYHKDEQEGSGAGLAMCRLIIQRCGGEIWLDREFEGGARFLFTLPKEKPDSFRHMPIERAAPSSGIDLARA